MATGWLARNKAVLHRYVISSVRLNKTEYPDSDLTFFGGMSDLFHEEIPDEFLDRVFAVMALASEHTFHVLTKRAERMREYMATLSFRSAPVSLAIVRTPWYESAQGSPCSVGTIEERIEAGPLPNVWLGVSCENQKYADERIPLLLQTPAAVRFVSVEPMLGPVDLLAVPAGSVPGYAGLRLRDRLSWCIVGGESGGPLERALVRRCSRSETYSQRCGTTRFGTCPACNETGWEPKPEALAWVRSLRDQCVAAGVPFFFKQWGGPTAKSGGRLLDGREWNERP